MCCASPRFDGLVGAGAGALVALLAAAPALAQCPAARPTDPVGGGGLLHYNDPGSVVAYDASTEVRVWYAPTGEDAPPPSAKGMSGAPLNVELVGDVVEQARVAFAALGFVPALRDGDYEPCASNGGDGRLDVYLIAFPAGADGAAPADRCTSATTVTCSGFVLIDNDFANSHYASFEEAVRVVLPHELFHLVQKAYDAEVDGWWAEATAQWAANALHPSLDDLERFLPTYFERPEQPLDLSGGGATNAWLYATAIWPLFLEERYGSTTLVDIFDELGAGNGPALAAAAAALDVSLGNAFQLFASYNAATGERALAGTGYADASAYPMVPVTVLEAGEGVLHEGVLAGLSAHYFLSRGARRVSLDADPMRVAALAIPLEDGHAVLSKQQELPANLDGDFIIVVSGRHTSKVDTAFQLEGTALITHEPAPEPAPAPAAHAPPSPVDTGGCALHAGAPAGSALSILLLAAAFAARQRVRDAKPHPPTQETP